MFAFVSIKRLRAEQLGFVEHVVCDGGQFVVYTSEKSEVGVSRSVHLFSVANFLVQSSPATAVSVRSLHSRFASARQPGQSVHPASCGDS